VPDLGGADFWELRERDDGSAAFFRKVDGACIFLGPDNLCRIHATFGAAAKPWFCRVFPHALVAAPEGLRLGWTPGCASRHRRDGPATPLSASVAGLWEDVDDLPFRAVSPEGTSLPAGVRMSPSAYPAVERALLREIARPRSRFADVFPALRAVLRAVAAALHASEVPEQAAGAWSAPLARLVAAFELAADDVCAAFPGTDQSKAAAGVAQLLRAPAHPASSPPPLGSGRDSSALTPDARVFLTEELANHVFTGGVTHHGGLAEGFGAFLFPALASHGFAAAGAGEPVNAAALNAAWVACHLGLGWWAQVASLEPNRTASSELFLAFAAAP